MTKANSDSAAALQRDLDDIWARYDCARKAGFLDGALKLAAKYEAKYKELRRMEADVAQDGIIQKESK